MNKGSPTVHKGMIGQLLVQLRLLQFGIEAASPLTDSGNDLIAVRAQTLTAIQVKTRTKGAFSLVGKPRDYNYLALVKVVHAENSPIADLEKSVVYLIPKKYVDEQQPKSFKGLDEFILNAELAAKYFPGPYYALWYQAPDGEKQDGMGDVWADTSAAAKEP